MLIQQSGTQHQQSGVSVVLFLVVIEDNVLEDEVIAAVRIIKVLKGVINECFFLWMELEEAVEVLQVEKPDEHRTVRSGCLFEHLVVHFRIHDFPDFLRQSFNDR